MPERLPQGGRAPAPAEAGSNAQVTLGAAAPYRGPGGFLLLDKPVGVSSFQALRPVKRAFRKAKVGHAGTLDPAASGLLIAGVAAGTRLLEYLEAMPKTYAFTAHFGFVSDTYDGEGRLEAHAGSRSAETLDAGTIAGALAPFRGRIRQAPPAYSAIKVGGERAYALARAGETVVLEAREVEVHSLELKAFHPGGAGSGNGAAPDPEAAPRADLVMTCSKGTYVRSLAHDLGQALGCGAYTGALRRLAIGPFRVEDAIAPESVSAEGPLLPLETAVSRLPKVIVPPAWEARFLNGQTVTVELPQGATGPVPAGGVEARAHSADGRLLAIAALSPGGSCRPRKVLAQGSGA